MAMKLKGLIQFLCIFLQGHTLFVNSFLPRTSYRTIFKSTCRWTRHSNTNVQSLGATVTPSPQLLEFQEPLTNVTVILIGSMHYNPASVRLVSQTVQELGQSNRLGSVVVESCDIRWNKTLELYNNKPFLKNFLGNEMKAAQEEAFAFDLPVILGDQRINITFAAMKESLKDTFTDIFTPPNGWRRFKKEISHAYDEVAPSGDSKYLSATAFLDPKLLLGLPVSLFKYPLSYFVRDPIRTSMAFAFFFGLSSIIGTDESINIGAFLEETSQITFTDYVANLALAIFETLVFARLLLKPLLADRNIILAQNILQQCKLFEVESSIEYKAFYKKGNGGLFDFLFGNDFGETYIGRGLIPNDVIYAPGSQTNYLKKTKQDKAKVVVAVLGMAHLNGVMKLLKEQSLREMK